MFVEQWEMGSRSAYVCFEIKILQPKPGFRSLLPAHNYKLIEKEAEGGRREPAVRGGGRGSLNKDC